MLRLSGQVHLYLRWLVFDKKWANFTFGLFKQSSIQFLQQINVKNVNYIQYRWLVAAPIITNLANYHSQNKNTLFEPNACSEDVRNFLNGCLQNFSLKRLIKISQIPRR